MQRILNWIYVVIVVLVVYLWVQQTPAGANLPKISIEMPGAQPEVSATTLIINATTTSVTMTTMTSTMTMTMTPTMTPTSTPTPTPATFAVSVDTMVRKISNTRKLTTVETILDVVVTFDDTEKKLGWWDGGELLVQRTTVTAAVGVDLQKVSIQQINDHWIVSVPASKILSLTQAPEKPYYYKQGIVQYFVEGQKDTWRDMMPAEVNTQARERICQLGLHDKASSEAREYIIGMALAFNPNMTERDITVNVAPSNECSRP